MIYKQIMLRCKNTIGLSIFEVLNELFIRNVLILEKEYDDIFDKVRKTISNEVQINIYNVLIDYCRSYYE